MFITQGSLKTNCTKSLSLKSQLAVSKLEVCQYCAMQVRQRQVACFGIHVLLVLATAIALFQRSIQIIRIHPIPTDLSWARIFRCRIVLAQLQGLSVSLFVPCKFQKKSFKDLGFLLGISLKFVYYEATSQLYLVRLVDMQIVRPAKACCHGRVALSWLLEVTFIGFATMSSAMLVLFSYPPKFVIM